MGRYFKNVNPRSTGWSLTPRGCWIRASRKLNRKYAGQTKRFVPSTKITRLGGFQSTLASLFLFFSIQSFGRAGKCDSSYSVLDGEDPSVRDYHPGEYTDKTRNPVHGHPRIRTDKKATETQEQMKAPCALSAVFWKESTEDEYFCSWDKLAFDRPGFAAHFGEHKWWRRQGLNKS